MKRFGLTIGLVFVLIVQGCGVTMPPVQGTVMDLVTGQPIPDVDVVVLYIGGGKGPDGHYYNRCSANQITKTDTNGHWEVKGRHLDVNPKVLRYALLLYKDGYREGSPGRYESTVTTKINLTADKDVYEWDEGYQIKRDYTKIHNQTIEHYQKTFLTPYNYLGDNILGSDNDHQTLFYGCAEKGSGDPGLNAFAQKFILKWIDSLPADNAWDYTNACLLTMDYVRLHPEFMSALHATEARSKNLKTLCENAPWWDKGKNKGKYNAALGIE